MDLEEIPSDFNVVFVVPLTMNEAVRQLLDANFENCLNYLIAPWYTFEKSNFMQLRNC